MPIIKSAKKRVKVSRRAAARILEAAGARISVVGGAIPLTLWNPNSSNLRNVTGRLTLRGRPVAGARLAVDREVAHGEPLHDLGEIAGRVVRRQQREHRAGRRRNAVDEAGELAMAIGVDRDRHRLAGADALELRLLVVGDHPDLWQRHHLHGHRQQLVGRWHVAARPEQQ